MTRKTENGGKFRNVHSRTWNMARKLKIIENEKQSLGRELWQETLKNVTNEKNTVRPGIWQEN